MEKNNGMVPQAQMGVAPAGGGATAMVETASRRELAEVQGMMFLAKQFPRDEKAALDRIVNACQRRTLAEVAVYQYARGGTDISGPSIRLAEAMAQNWGNLQFGLRELEQRNGESTVEAFAWDLQTNTRQSRVFQVPHLRFTKQGTTVLKDPRDIYEMVANQGQRRVRACILGVIPGDVVDRALEECDATLAADIKITPATLKSLCDRFEPYGVKKEHIEARIQRRLDSITPAQILQLQKIYNSLRDNMSKPGEWFEIAPDGKPAADSWTTDAPPASTAPAKSRLRQILTPEGSEQGAAPAGAGDGEPARDPVDENGEPLDPERDTLMAVLLEYKKAKPKAFAKALNAVGAGEDWARTLSSDALENVRKLVEKV